MAMSTDTSMPSKLPGKPRPGARQRHDVMRIARDRDPDEAAIADDRVGRIIFGPSRARQEDAHPCMRVAAADHTDAARRRIDIARDEACGEAEAARRLDHQHRIVAARAAAPVERLARRLGALLVARDIGEVGADRPASSPPASRAFQSRRRGARSGAPMCRRGARDRGGCVRSTARGRADPRTNRRRERSAHSPRARSDRP